MDCGYFTLTDNPPSYGADRRDANQFLREVLAESVLAEELGFASVWLPEHHFGLFGCLPTPALYLAHLAAKTRRVKLAPGTVVLPINQPLRLAEEFLSLDLLSDGRAIFCAGRGYDHREYDGFGVSIAESRERFDEAFALVRRAFTEEQFTFDGKYYQVPEPVTVLPRPVQQPHPPMYVACWSLPTIEMAAREGYHAIFAPFAAAMMHGGLDKAAAAFRALAAEAGQPRPRVMCSYFFAIVDDPAEKRRAQERLMKYLLGAAPALVDRDKPPPPHLAYMADVVAQLERLEPSDLGERSFICGSPEECIAALKRVEAAGVDEVILYFNFGALDHRQTTRMMERFAREILPHVGAAPAAVSP
jgi:alkanesulfonate monooxygenase SsuD/methylene tetrahydromethanopterin reductase-like flavin-dependent oxidoreductase (luciferase family)